MMENYLEILEESLKQKDEILQKIVDYSNKQEELLKQDKLPMEEFDTLVDQKDILIKQLGKIDEGFEKVYARIKDQIAENKEMHRAQIVRLQHLISLVTEKSVCIQAQEQRNKVMVEQHFSKSRRDMRQGKRSSKAAYDYYKNMNNTNVVSSQFLDQKK
ncbi:MAG TPA: flagellar export chaperone FlgN [Lachnospiraceae bacterium]|nr:flagellar export chaperone FlgN [Lachnospiraceae bacterium]